MVKECNFCREIKSVSEFHKHPSGSYGVRGTCKQCISTRKNRKDKQLQKRYGISIEQYNELFDKQQGCCAICGFHQSQLTVSLAVDHNHLTKKVRGLLCYNCNSGLGRFKDNIANLSNAIEYLKSE